MRKDFLKKIITSKAGYVVANGYGYGQVEPNHLANQSTKQSYGQLPVDKAITQLENGMFAKYDLANGKVDFDGAGEWMLVWNEIKLYRDEQLDCEFAMLADDYDAQVYSPYGYEDAGKQSRFYNGVDSQGQSSITVGGKTYQYSDVTKDADPYEIDFTNDPFHIDGKYHEAMIDKTKVNPMFPRLIKTEVGDIITTNTIKDASVDAKDFLTVGADGILAVSGQTLPASGMAWQVVKVYTMPDGQPGVKIQRVQ